MKRWAVYYGDGSRFTDEDGAPSEAPPFDVQAIAYPDETVGRVVIDSWDYYVFRESESEWFGCDIFGLFDVLAHEPGCVVKFARTRSNEAYRAAVEMARSDPYLPRKSNRDGRRER